MRTNSHSTANALKAALETIPVLEVNKEVNKGYAAEQSQEILLSNLEFAERLFPDSGLSLCPISHAKTTYISKNCEKVLGHPHQELLRMGLPELFELVHPNDLPSVQQCFEYMRNMSPFDPEEYRFVIHYRMRTKSDEYIVIKNEHLAIKVTDKTYLYLMLYNRTSDAEKFHHVNLEVLWKVNGAFVRTGAYHPKQEEKEMTPRQNEIARLVAKGYSNQDIADQLGVSLFTIKNHKKMLFRRVNVKNSLQLASYIKQASF